MAQAATNQTSQSPTPSEPSTANGNGNGKREAKPPTALEAMTKISRILKLLKPDDRKRVLTFLNDETHE